MKIQANTVRLFKTVHSWTGLVSGLLLFLAFYAGALTIFREDIAAWQNGAPHQLGEALLPDVRPLVERVIGRHPEARQGLMINLPDGHESGLEAVWRQAGEVRRARLSADGGLVEADDQAGRLSVVIDELHRTAGIPGLPGELVMGTVALLYGLALVSGAILYLPSIWRNLFALRLGKNLKLMWRDAHNSIGILSLPFHVLFALTGAVTCIHDPLLAGMNALIYGDQGKPLLMSVASPAGRSVPSGETAQMLSAGEMVAAARERIPGFQPQHLIFMSPGDRNGIVTLMGDQPGVLAHSARVAMSSVTGEVLVVETSGDRPSGMTALSGLAALHFGDYGGAPVAWVYFALGMAGAFLFYSGNLLWLESRRKRQGATGAWHHLALARLTVGFCLGSCAAFSLLFIVARLPAGSFGDVGLLPVFWTGVALAIGWSAFRPPVKGARDLLIVAAAASAGIPLAYRLTEGHLAWSGVDLTAVAAALFFLALARLTGRRSKKALGASVWDADEVEALVKAR